MSILHLLTAILIGYGVGFACGVLRGRRAGQSDALLHMLSHERKARAALSVLFEAKARQAERSHVVVD
jgi:hypothetical protein